MSIKIFCRINAKVLRLGLTVLFLFISPLSAYGDRLAVLDTDSQEFECSAVVKDASASFFFHSEAQIRERWNWNRDQASPEAFEYRWVVHIVNRLGKMDFGNYKSVVITAEPEEGSIEELLSSGENILFRYTSSDSMVPFKPVFEETIVTRTNDSDIVVELTGVNLITMLFADQPRAAHFWMIESGQPARKCRAIIEYRYNY